MCKHCGYCEHCGRGSSPWYVQPQTPYLPQYTYPWIVWQTGDTSDTVQSPNSTATFFTGQWTPTTQTPAS